MLEARFIKTRLTKKLLRPSRGAISTFAARRDLARCLGLIDKVIYQDLGIMGDIRNRFAHSRLSMSFSDEEIVSKCNGFNFAQRIFEKMESKPEMPQSSSHFVNE